LTGLEAGMLAPLGHGWRAKRRREVLSREQIREILAKWNQAWNAHDLDRVMELFHDEVLFENFSGAKVRGRERLRQAWSSWFADHGGFRFTEEDTFIDEVGQKALYRWRLDWPCAEKGLEGRHERRRGVDVIHFRDGKIVQKLTYCKTTIEVDGRRVRLCASP